LPVYILVFDSLLGLRVPEEFVLFRGFKVIQWTRLSGITSGLEAWPRLMLTNPGIPHLKNA
jgi:hypothetical protein